MLSSRSSKSSSSREQKGEARRGLSFLLIQPLSTMEMRANQRVLVPERSINWLEAPPLAFLRMISLPLPPLGSFTGCPQLRGHALQ